MAFFPEVFLGTHTFFYRDYGTFGYPLAHYHRESFWRGEIPLWNPLSNCGLPYLAQWNTMTLYPLSLIYLVFPLPWSLGFFCLGHLVLGGWGMFSLTRRWTGNGLAAGIGGMAFALNGLTLHALMWPNNIAALGWMPWVILWGERACFERGRTLIVAALVGAVQMLAGAPEVIFFTWLILGGLVVFGAPGVEKNRWRERFRAVGSFLGLGLLVGALAAIQLLPFLDLLAQSQRDVNFDTNAWSMPIWGWANLLVPLFHMTPAMIGVYSQVDQQWTSSYYLGIAALALALLAVIQKRDRRVWTLAGLAAFGLLMALGKPGGLYAAIKALIPQLGFIRFPIKYVLLAVFAVPALAAIGMAAVLNADRKPRRSIAFVVGGVALAVVFVLCLAWKAPVPDENPTITVMNGASRLGILAVFFALFWWHSRTVNTAHRRWLALGLVALVALDALTHAPRQNPTVPVAAYDTGLELFETKPAPGQSRAAISPFLHHFLGFAANTNTLQFCLRHRQAVYANWNLVDGMPKVNGFYSLYPREHAEVLEAIYSSTNRPPGPLLDFLAVSQVSSDRQLFAWEQRSTAMPLVSVGQEPVFSEHEVIRQQLTDMQFNPRQKVYLPAEARETTKAQADANAQAELVLFRNDELEIRVEAARPALVVIAQTWHPNWRAWVNRAPAPILRANHAFQAIEVPAGSSDIRLAYIDRKFQLGTLISGAALLGCAAMWGWSMLVNRRRNRT